MTGAMIYTSAFQLGVMYHGLFVYLAPLVILWTDSSRLWVWTILDVQATEASVAAVVKLHVNSYSSTKCWNCLPPSAGHHLLLIILR
jgi:hypothetical protein